MSNLEGPNVVILARDPKVRAGLASHLDVLRNQFESLRVKGIEPEMISGDLEQNAQVVLIDLDVWDPAGEQIIVNLRDLGFKGPVLIIVKKDPKQILPLTRIFERVVFLNKPFDTKEMLGVVKRMVLAPIIAARKHARHDTNETAQLQINGQALSYSCSVKNMSKGGAYLEFARSVNARIGDIVIFKVKLGQVNREYRLRARVAWLNRTKGIGIEFINTSDND